MAFVFYDTETTGSDPDWDQILQFAAIRTDDALVETDRLEIRCRLQPHVVPSPGALAVTGGTVAQLLDGRLPSHYAMMRTIHDTLLRWSPAVFLGYNSLEFDEVLLRQALYQTLHPPFLTSTGGNRRADVMQMVLAAEHFRPGVLQFRQRHDGKPSFRLDQVAPANGFNHANAHDALADVTATIFVAGRIRAGARDLWDHMIGLGDRASATAYALAEPLRLYTEFNHNRPHHWLVTALAADPDRNAHVIAYDLAVDPATLTGLDGAALQRRLTTAPKPLRPIKANLCPIVQPWTAGIGRLAAAELGEAALRRRAAAVHGDAGLRRRLLGAYGAVKPAWEPSPYVEGQIYEGFASAADAALMESFHRSAGAARLDAAAAFEDRRFRQIAHRLIYLESPDLLGGETRHAVETIIARRIATEEKVPWLTLAQALDDAEEAIGAVGGRDSDRLVALQDFLRQRLAWAATVLSAG